MPLRAASRRLANVDVAALRSKYLPSVSAGACDEDTDTDDDNDDNNVVVLLTLSWLCRSARANEESSITCRQW
jgi:hypothetical protein